MNALQRLDELIEESREIEAKAEKLQAGGILNLSAPHAIHQFQHRSESWYASAIALLPPDLRERFEREWIGPVADCGQQDFVADPNGSAPDRRKIHIDPTKFRFTYPYERCFREPLLRQRRILLEAKHHSDFARRSRLDEDGVLAQPGFDNLHPKVVDAVGSRFQDGHYRDSILRSCIALTVVIREKTGSEIKQDTALIEKVFSLENPILKIAGNEDERRGMMWLFKGAVMGLRHPRAHHLGEGEDVDATEAFEWLAFISALMRVIDRAELVRNDNVPAPISPAEIVSQ